MHVVIAFESQVDARSALIELTRRAQASGAPVTGAALARRDADRGIHVEAVNGYELPPHLMRALDVAVDPDGGHALLAGESALVLGFSCEDTARELVADARLEERGALWVEAEA